MQKAVSRLRSLTDKPIRLLEFYEHVNRASLGGEDYGDPFEGIVELLEGLTSGQITTSVALELRSYRAKDGIHVDEDGRAWWEGPYFIKPFYWMENGLEGINFIQSSVSLQSRYVCARRCYEGNHIHKSISDIFVGLDSSLVMRDCVIFIEDPAKSIEIVFSNGLILPSTAAIKRYENYSNKLMNEIVIVAWRYLAVLQPDKTEGVSSAIVSHIRSYLEAHGLYEGDKGFLAREP